MVPDSVVQAVKTAPDSRWKNILLALWGEDDNARNKAYTELEQALSNQEEIPL